MNQALPFLLTCLLALAFPKPAGADDPLGKTARQEMQEARRNGWQLAVSGLAALALAGLAVGLVYQGELKQAYESDADARSKAEEAQQTEAKERKKAEDARKAEAEERNKGEEAQRRRKRRWSLRTARLTSVASA